MFCKSFTTSCHVTNQILTGKFVCHCQQKRVPKTRFFISISKSYSTCSIDVERLLLYSFHALHCLFLFWPFSNCRLIDTSVEYSLLCNILVMILCTNGSCNTRWLLMPWMVVYMVDILLLTLLSIFLFIRSGHYIFYFILIFEISLIYPE